MKGTLRQPAPRWCRSLTDPAWDSPATNGFAIDRLHDPVATWTPFGLLGGKAGAVAKGLAVFAVSLGASRAGAALLRRAPPVGRVL
ncbi:hypothetical protein SQ03_23460 [Methylobacterium platani JCM 14648]|uniref:Uncharacterized protein n=2 Tax=Methylobacterium platani TaxID=427683 RepID=A0A179SBP6_9HYPH|nr:hypothetical protein SQ03_23460 [Methylobacterium platani JCM 14648]OAS25276.1 hypothetical protein A5481_10195 [Methylobacterium platani]